MRTHSELLNKQPTHSLHYTAVRPIRLLVPTAIITGKYILSYYYLVVFILVSNYNATSEDIGRGNKRKDGGLRQIERGKWEHTLGRMSALWTHTAEHCQRIQYAGIEGCNKHRHTHTHSNTQAPWSCLFRSQSFLQMLALPLSFPRIPSEVSSIRTRPCIQAKLLAGLMIR